MKLCIESNFEKPSGIRSVDRFEGELGQRPSKPARAPFAKVNRTDPARSTSQNASHIKPIAAVIPPSVTPPARKPAANRKELQELAIAAHAVYSVPAIPDVGFIQYWQISQTSIPMLVHKDATEVVGQRAANH